MIVTSYIHPPQFSGECYQQQRCQSPESSPFGEPDTNFAQVRSVLFFLILKPCQRLLPETELLSNSRVNSAGRL